MDLTPGDMRVLRYLKPKYPFPLCWGITGYFEGLAAAGGGHSLAELVEAGLVHVVGEGRYVCLTDDAVVNLYPLDCSWARPSMLPHPVAWKVP